MHLGWGLGTLAGMVRFGAPLAALSRLLGRREPALAEEPDGAVCAPSLRGEDA